MRWPLVMALALIMFTVGVRQAQFMFAAWPNSSGLIQLLRTQVRPNVGRILMEEDEVPRYYLQDIVSDWQWNHLYWFDYQTKNGETLSGAPAYKAAIADGYWDWVVLLYGYNAGLARQIDPALGPDSDYELLAKVPYHTAYGNGYYWVWRKKQPPPAASLR